jgi:hypothetical protein
MASLKSRRLVPAARTIAGFGAILLMSGCGTVIDTDHVPPPAATATAVSLQKEKASYVHPKLIGPDFKLERVNESSDCAPDSDRTLPDSCKGKMWRSFNVIAQSSSGMHVSQDITQYLDGTSTAVEALESLSLHKDLFIGQGRSRLAEASIPDLPDGTATLIAARRDGSDEYLVVIAPKLEYTAAVLVWGYDSSRQDAAASLASRVLWMLLDRIPDKLGGPVPNPDYIGNRYWDVK